MATRAANVVRIDPGKQGWGCLMEADEWRLQRLEADVASIKTDIAAMRELMAQQQMSLYEAFVSRREYTEWRDESKREHGEIERAATKRLDQLDATMNKAAFTTIGALLTALVALAKAWLGA